MLMRKSLDEMGLWGIFLRANLCRRPQSTVDVSTSSQVSLHCIRKLGEKPRGKEQISKQCDPVLPYVLLQSALTVSIMDK